MKGVVWRVGMIFFGARYDILDGERCQMNLFSNTLFVICFGGNKPGPLRGGVWYVSNLPLKQNHQLLCGQVMFCGCNTLWSLANQQFLVKDLFAHLRSGFDGVFFFFFFFFFFFYLSLLRVKNDRLQLRHAAPCPRRGTWPRRCWPNAFHCHVSIRFHTL